MLMVTTLGPAAEQQITTMILIIIRYSNTTGIQMVRVNNTSASLDYYIIDPNKLCRVPKLNLNNNLPTSVNDEQACYPLVGSVF